LGKGRGFNGQVDSLWKDAIDNKQQRSITERDQAKDKVLGAPKIKSDASRRGRKEKAVFCRRGATGEAGLKVDMAIY